MCAIHFFGTLLSYTREVGGMGSGTYKRHHLVDRMGFEPTTSAMRVRRSSD